MDLVGWNGRHTASGKSRIVIGFSAALGESIDLLELMGTDKGNLQLAFKLNIHNNVIRTQTACESCW